MQVKARAREVMAGTTMAAVLGACAVLPGSAAADVTLPTPGTVTECSFAAQPAPARTSCRTTTVRVADPLCVQDDTGSYLLYDVSIVARAITYAGNVVAGEPIGDVYPSIRPHARLLSDSGPHGYGVGYQVKVDAC